MKHARYWDAPDGLSVMMGAACGDVAGSIYEWRNIRYRLDEAHLLSDAARFTDDTAMTCGVADGLRLGLSQLPGDWMNAPGADSVLSAAVQQRMRFFGLTYPHAGYGSKFNAWLHADDPQPYNSWGNGSAMRVSPAGWFARTLEEAERLAEISANVTHNHPEGVKGAVAVAGSIFLLRQGGGKEAVRSYVSRFYDLNFTLDGIRDTYTFDASCMGSVPQAIVAFLEGSSFANTLSGAISIGGDSDTIAAIAGSLAEVIYPIPPALLSGVTDRLPEPVREALSAAAQFALDR